LVALIVGGCLFFLLVQWLAPEQTTRLVATTGVVLMALLSWALLRRGRTAAAIQVLSVGSWGAITLIAVFHGGVLTPTVFAYPLVIFMTGWLLSPRAAVRIAALSALVVSAFVLAQYFGALPTPPSTPPLMHALVQITVFFLAAALITALVNLHARQLREIDLARADLAQHAASLEASRAELQLAQTVANIGSWVYTVADDALRFSPEACRIFKLPPGLRFSHDQYINAIHPEDRARADGQWQAALVGGSLDSFDSEHRILQYDGVRWVRLKAQVTFDADGKPIRADGVTQDITERKKADALIHELAFYDPLTGLANRRLLSDRLQQTLLACASNASAGALFFIDLDHFKVLNDTRGHDQGDILLQAVAQRLRESVRELDTVARLGGDEFVVVMGNLQGSKAHIQSQCEAVGRQILTALRLPYTLGETEHRCSASVGVTLFDGSHTSIDELLKQADLAMYRSKDSGRNQLQFFAASMSDEAMARATTETELRSAIETGHLVLHYQPQVHHDGTVIGAEALVRWAHPTGGLVQPNDFIAIAEETELIVPLGHWVLQTACFQLQRWSLQPRMAHLSIAVNVSACQFRADGFVQSVAACLRASGADGQKLVLELTESVLISDVSHTVQTMQELKALGVQCALDDFGTGYSSLSYLKELPIYQLKIDRSFVRDILNTPSDAAIARAVIALARGLDMRILAEGVETADQRAFLSELGCQAYQGFFFSRPVDVQQFEAWFNHHQN
jgi:diguanylate cyclase (GGDEF)-like protein